MTSNIYLCTLSVCGCLFLSTVMITWLDSSFGMPLYSNSEIGCKLLTFGAHSWYVGKIFHDNKITYTFPHYITDCHSTSLILGFLDVLLFLISKNPGQDLEGASPLIYISLKERNNLRFFSDFICVWMISWVSCDRCVVLFRPGKTIYKSIRIM